jgi:uncharacterized membrane protein YuzA (DUF378 family)
MRNKKMTHIIAFAFVIIGALNVSLFGILPSANGDGFDLLQTLFGFSPILFEIISALIGVSAVYLLVTHRKECISFEK